MRATAALLVTLLAGVPYARMIPAAKPCCCSHNGTCPLKSAKHSNCAGSCSIDRASRPASSVAPQESRGPEVTPARTSLTIAPPRVVARLVIAATQFSSVDIPPDVPPPRFSVDAGFSPRWFSRESPAG